MTDAELLIRAKKQQVWIRKYNLSIQRAYRELAARHRDEFDQILAEERAKAEKEEES